MSLISKDKFIKPNFLLREILNIKHSCEYDPVHMKCKLVKYRSVSFSLQYLIFNGIMQTLKM